VLECRRMRRNAVRALVRHTDRGKNDLLLNQGE
jgi:hypothetical protein